MTNRGHYFLALGATLGLVACSGRYGVGFEQMADAAGAGGADQASNSSASGGSAVTAGAAAGSASTGEAGAPGSVEPTASRCGFAPEGPPDDARPLLPSEQVLSRIQLLLDGVSSAPRAGLPAEPTPEWAAAQAEAILDDHVATQTVPSGLARFLEQWTELQPTPTTELTVPKRWALQLAEPAATLATLLAEPADEAHRLGILTEPDFLMMKSSISSRGTWMMERLFCRSVPAQPPSIGQVPETAGETRRERLESMVSGAACSSCHVLIDPLGDALEHFDEHGAYRELDAGQAVNAAASMSDPALSFESFDDLAPQLAESCAVAQCFSQTMLRHAFGKSLQNLEPAIGEVEANHVANQFADADFSVRALVRAIVTTPSFLR